MTFEYGLEFLAALCVHHVFRHDENVQVSRLCILLVGVPTSTHLLFCGGLERTLLGFLRSLVFFHVSLIGSILVYRLSPWHPLSQYPGPLSYKVSKVYWALSTWHGQQHKIRAELHEKYGDVVRIGPNELSLSNTSAIESLMGASGQPKGQFWEGRLPLSAPTTHLVGMRDKKEHVRRRKPWQRAMTLGSIKHYEQFLTTRTQQLVNLLRQTIPAPVDMNLWVGYYTFDVMSDIVFGEGPEMMRDGDKDNLWHLIEDFPKCRTLFFFGTIPWFGKLALLLAKRIHFIPGVRQYRNYMGDRIQKRKAQGSPHKDLFHHLIDEDGMLEQKPTDAEISSDSSLSIVAGADTTSSTLTSFFYLVMGHPKAYQLVQQEVDSLGNDFTNPDKQARLPYLNAAINETLRLFPPVLSGSQREVRRGCGAAVIGPYTLAEGTAASIAFSVVHRDARNFSPHPELFLPERWLHKDQRERLKPEIFNQNTPYVLNQNAFLAFSYGPANCVGKHLAYTEIRLVICSLLHHFYFKFACGYSPLQYEDDLRDYYVALKGPLPTVLTPRY